MTGLLSFLGLLRPVRDDPAGGGSGAAIHVVIQRAYTWIGEQIANNDGVYSVLRAP
jgi:hypothetical protein